MRDPGERARKYGAKVRGLVIPGQKKRFQGAAGSQIEAELFVKGLGVPALYQNYYMIFAKEVNSIRDRHSGQLAQDEVCVAFERWNSRGLTDTVLNSIVTHYNFDSCAVPTPPACAWDFKMTLTFSGNISATNLDDFPVLVHLTAGNFDFTHAQANGEDIRFMDTDICPSDGTPLKHEIENWDSVGQEAWIWVKVPRIDGGSVIDTIYMYFDNGVAPDGQDVNGTWNAAYRGVWHLPDLTPTTTFDSTSFAHNGTKMGVGNPVEINGEFYKGQDFSNDYIDWADHSDHRPTLLTVGAWIRPDSTSLGAGGHAIVNNLHFTGAYWGYQLRIFAGELEATVGMTILGNLFVDQGAVTMIAGNWYYVALTVGATRADVWIDGVSVGNVVYAVDTIRYHAVKPGLCLSAHELRSGEWYTGDTDEVRVADGAKSTDWIMGQYRSMTEVLITFGAETPT